MRAVNIHEREIAAPPAAMGELLDSLASDHDKLWPVTHCPPMRFDRPQAARALGGHDPIPYAVVEYSLGG